MADLQKLVSLAAAVLFVAASLGSLILNRNILLTGTYKFPFPLATSVLELSLVSILALLATILLRLGQRLVGRQNKYSSLSTSNDYTHDFREGRGYTEPYLEYNEKEASCDQLGLVPLVSCGSSLRALGNKLVAATYSHAYFVVVVVFAARTALSNTLLGRAPFSTFALALLFTWPCCLAFASHTEAKSNVAQLFAATLLAFICHFFYLQHIGTTDILLISSIIILDSLLAGYLPTYVLRMWHREHEREWQSHQENSPQRSSTPLGPPSFDLLQSFVWSLARITVPCTIILAVTCLISGEYAKLKVNCYVLDLPDLWYRIIGASGINIILYLLLLVNSLNWTPVAVSALHVPVAAIGSLIFGYHRLTPEHWIGVTLSVFLSLQLLLQARTGRSESSSSVKRNLASRIRQLPIPLFICLIIYGSYVSYEYRKTGRVGLSKSVWSTQRTPVQLANTTLNASLPMSNLHNHDYLGARPVPDTYADLDRIMHNCIDNGPSGVEDILACLHYLTTASDDYLHQPKKSWIGRRDDLVEPRSAIRHHQRGIFSFGSKADTGSSKDCSGPIRLYHTYWTGRAGWRFELFIKAYLYSQMLSCSQLYVWLDTDIEPAAIDGMMNNDRAFEKFRVLVDEGFIVLKPWAVPDMIPLPAGADKTKVSELIQGNNTEHTAKLSSDIIRDDTGSNWLRSDPLYKIVSNPTQVSDFVRFWVLHLHGGVYLDMDVLLLRDLRPLLLAQSDDKNATQPAWAEQWVEHSRPGDYNTAVLSLPANSSLSTYLLRGGVRMGMNFHPRVLGRMLFKDGHTDSLTMLQNAVFDPLVTNLRREGTTACTVPCHKNFQSSFMGTVDEPENEWSNYDGPHIDRDSMTTNRTLNNFFRGAFAYHIHNQWWKFPDQTSWMDVITRAQDAFFAGDRPNAYGEKWAGPAIASYDRSTWGWSS